ncbi:hypothetical protein GCM10022209_41350 [Chitinophaga oryziterrae]
MLFKENSHVELEAATTKSYGSTPFYEILPAAHSLYFVTTNQISDPDPDRGVHVLIH